VICVTHGGILGQLFRHVAEQGEIPEQDLEDYAAVRPANGCISRFAIYPPEKDNLSYRWKLISWADASHLVGDASPAETNYDAAIATG
jgi:broad specificity phosphatase PhoE